MPATARQDAFLSAARLVENGQTQSAADALAASAAAAAPRWDEPTVRREIDRIEAIGVAPSQVVLLANLLRSHGYNDLCARLLALVPKPGRIAEALTLAANELAAGYETEAELNAARARYAERLTQALELARVLRPQALRQDFPACLSAMPFYLAYQGGADRELQASYGEIVTRIAAAALAPAYDPPPAPSGRIRILFATAFAFVHSVTKLFVGWIEKLDRARFEIAFFHLGRVEDTMTQRLREAADLFEFGPRPAAEWVEAVARFRPHVIVYLEIGMDAATLALAALRLAPVQAMAWGHPQTSGLATLDYFLTSDLMEPENAQDNYTETLVRLPNLSVCYTPPLSAAIKLDRARLGASAQRPLYLCCQSLFKYLPAYDFIYPQIAAAAPGALFLFIGRDGDPARRRLDARLRRAFAESGLDYREHVRFCEPLPFSQFAGLLGMCDVFLDSIGWSGGNTTLEAVEVGLPIVTLPTGLMRGRHTAAILAMLDMPEGVASSVEDYVAKAAALADPARRLAYVETLSARKARVFGDETPIRALEDFLIGAVARAYAEADLSFARQVNGTVASEQAAAR